VGIRPPVPPDDDRGGPDREGPGAGHGLPGRDLPAHDLPGHDLPGRDRSDDRARDDRAPRGTADGNTAPDDTAPDEGAPDEGLIEDGLLDIDPAARPADLTAEELHADPPVAAGLPAGAGPGTAAPDEPVLEWRVDRRLTWIKVVVAVLFVAGPWVVSASAASKLVGLVAGVGLAVWGLRDLAAPVRLRADAAGVTVVSGFAGHRRFGWKELDRVRLDKRSRLGMTSELLEIDAGESLHFLSRYELGETPADALDRIRRFRGLGGR